MELKELTGSPKQIKWANDIRQKILEICDENDFKLVKRSVLNRTEAKWFIDNCKIVTSKYETELAKINFLQSEEFHLDFYYDEKRDISRFRKSILEYWKENGYDVEFIDENTVTASKIW